MEASPNNEKHSSIQTVEMIHDDWNFNGKGSNALILPGNKRRKTEGKEKVYRRKKTLVSPAISKSKQRKLQKLQEEKEKKLMLCKSIKMLQKYKISDEAYSILQSSGTIGQAETLREKRRLAIHFSKAGLELPDGISLFNNKERKTSQNVKFLEGDVENVSPTAGPMMVADDSKQQSSQERLDFTIKNSMSVDDESDMLSAINGATKVRGGSVDEGVKSFIPLTFTTDNQSDARFQEQESNGANNICSRKPESPKTHVTLGHVNSAIVVHVSRPLEVQAQRKHLPIIMMEQEIMEAINEHSILILCGETGCGKTTQVPQFLYEAGYGSSNQNNRNGIIGITQPRRVAVLATAKRVSYELGLQLGREVGFQVRHDKMIGNTCSIKFMTDGILLREVQSDFLLKRYSVIILDEAHERSLNTDILIGMLSRIIKVREELFDEQHKKIVSGAKISPENLVTRLKVVLMSATLRVEDFVSNKRLFQVAPPVLEVPVRQFPVTIHFSRKTREDYVNNAYKKVLSIHKRLPHGGILVFLTGQREVEYLCKKLRKASQKFSEISIKKMDDESSSARGLDLKDVDEAFGMDDSFSDDQTEFEEIDSRFSESKTESEPDSELAEESEDESSLKIDGTVLNFLQNPESLSSLKTAFENLAGNNPKTTKEEEEPDIQPTSPVKESPIAPLYVLPLYAMLPASAQLRVFEKVPEGERLVVVATNVAETSLTIPGIRYVVDTGKEKVKNYNHGDGMASFEVQWISKASAAQRAGRAGRTGPGHCYRLYSAAAFGKDDIFAEFSCPEISKIPVDGVVLMMKFMGIDKVENFPFPTPPKISALEEAERCLKAIEALDRNGKLTSLGRSMAQFPMSPRHSRMILTVINILTKNFIFSRPNLLLAYAAASAAALSFPNPFIMQLDNHCNGDHKAQDHEEKLRKKELKSMVKASRARFHNPTSDSLTIAYALQSFDLAENAFDFCSSNTLHFKTMEEMSKLRKQILQLILHNQKARSEVSWPHGDFNDVQRAWLVPSSKHPLQINEEEILSQAICAGWADRVAKRVRSITGSKDKEHRVHSMRYQSSAMDEPVFLHRRSSVSQTAPEFVVYAELLCTNRPYMHGITAVKPDWLVTYANSSCFFSTPLADPKPYYEPLSDCAFCWVNPAFGRHNWQLPLHSLPIEDVDFRCAVFASALLEGNVLPCLKTGKNFLSATPSSLLRQEALGQRRMSDLLSRLRMGSVIVDSRAKLKEVWSENSVFLRSEIQNWFQKRFHGQLERLWEQMLEEAKLEGAELFPKRVERKRKVGR